MNTSIAAAVAALEAQRPILGDAVINAAIAALQAQAEPTAPVAQPPPPSPPHWEGERKLVTIVFADISGFTALSERLDPEIVRNLMNACFDHLVPVIERYGGTVDKFIGDEIMALFGAPMALENHAEQALLAALDMMHTLQALAESQQVNLQLHFGINTGVVIAGGIGSRGRQDYSVMGDAVNLAARLEDLSQSGEILVGPATYRLCSAAFDFVSLPPVPLKGKAEPVPVFQLMGRKQAPGKARGLIGLRAPLVGRRAEQEQLRAALRRAIDGRGSVIAIAGEPGLGKSRLVADLWDEFANQLTWAEGRALAYTGGMSYWMARDMVRCFVDARPDDPPAETAAALRRTAEDLFGPRLAEVYPFMSQLAETPLEPDMQVAVSELAPAALRGRLHRAFGEWVRALCARGPLALVWEDLHWADRSSLDLIETLLPLAAELPLLILLVYRQTEGEVDAWCARVTPAAAPMESILLQRLSDEAGADLLGQLLNVEAMPESARRMILSKAEGNPLFLEEVLRSLSDAGRILIDGSRAHATGPIDQLDVPDTLQGLIAARVDRLPPDDKHTLQLASVVGRVFQQAVLSHLYRNESGEATQPELSSLLQRELVRPRTETEYIFKHAVTHEVTYNSLLLARRKELHATAAEAIESLFPDQTDELAGTLAYHYLNAGRPAEAVDYLLSAGERAQRTYANAEAIDYFRAALGELDAPDWPDGQTQRNARRLVANERLGDVLATTGDYDAARDAYAAGLALTAPDDRVTLARWSRKTAESYMRQRMFADAETQLNSAAAALGDAPPDDPAWGYEHAWVLLNRVYAAYWMANMPLMREELKPAREAVLAYGDAGQRAELHRMELALAWQLKRFLLDEEVIGIAEEHLAAARAGGRLEAQAWALTMRGLSALFHWPRLPDEADAFLKAGIEMSNRAGSQDVLLVGRHWLAYLQRVSGDVDATAEHAEALLPMTESVPFYRGGAQSDLAWVALRRGDREAADMWSRRAAETQAKAPPMINWMTHVVQMRLAWDEGRTADAVERVRAMLHPSQMTFPPQLKERYEAVVAHWDAGRSDDAHEELGRALSLAVELGYD